MCKNKVQVCVYNMNKLVDVTLERGRGVSGREGGGRKEREQAQIPV